MLDAQKDRSLAWRSAILAIMIGLMWLARALDSLTPPSVFAFNGIIPRTSDGLAGIIAAPFIHADFTHLVANTIPLAILGALIAIRGTNQLLIVIQLSILIGGAGAWLFGTPRSEHIGASGIVFGFIGFLLFRSVFDRRPSSIVVTVIVAAMYGGALASSIVPDAGVSWSSHTFGFLGGIAAARFLHPAGSRRGSRRAARLHIVRDDDAAEEEVRRWIDGMRR